MAESSVCTGRLRRGLASAALLLALGGAGAAVPADASGVRWLAASSDAEVDRAFAQARASGKPVFLYWGAVWCPPCNQVKATLFSRADFVDRSRAFVPVYVDGDKPGSQKVASRFRVQGYPTMVILRPDGAEVTRLPGEVDPERYLLALGAALEAQTPVRELLRRAEAGGGLAPQDWRLLAFHSWETDQPGAGADADLGTRLAALAGRVPSELVEVRERLLLKSLAARADGPPDPAASAAGREFLHGLLQDKTRVSRHADVLTASARPVLTWVAPAGEQRSELARRWDLALSWLLESSTLSKPARIDVLDARVAAWKLAGASSELPAQQRDAVLKEVARIVVATTDRYERQAVVPGAAHVLREAGLIDASDELLRAELPTAVAPYYHMLALGANARRRGDNAAALGWYEEAWRKSEGPATRLQWGAGYVGHLLQLAPEDAGRIERSARAVIAELQPKSETFYERNQRALSRLALRLVEWQGANPERRRSVAAIRRQLAAVCAKLPARDPGRANCTRVFPAA